MSDTVVAAFLAMGGGGTALLALGVCVLAGALLWRVGQLNSVRRRIRQTLNDADPDVRRHGIALAADRGLASSADMLLEVARSETDPGVLEGLVQAVARRQWEPASTPRIVELRLWAKAYVDAHDHLRAEPVPEDPRRSTDTTPEDLAAIAARTVPGTSATRVLVTGAGGAAGVAVIGDLQAHGHYVIAVDADDTAVGLRLADEGHVVPDADDPAYVADLLDVVAASKPDALVCTVAEEYVALVPAADKLAEAGVATLMPSLDAVDACIDKWRFAEVAREHGLPVPPTALGGADGVGRGPWIVKPRRGRGSRDVHVVRTQATLRAALRAVPEPMVQPLLGGREFTADVLVDRTGEVVAIAPRWRLETKAGISTKGRTFEDSSVDEAVRQVVTAVGLVGPANVQGFVSNDGVMVHEVNPRFSGGLPLTLHAGADVVEEYLRAILGQPVRRDRLVARPDVVMYRHFAEVFEG